MAALLIMGMAAGQNLQRVVRVYSDGNVVFQLPTTQVDSIKSHDRLATFHYGDGSWSRNIHKIDSMTFAMVPTTDTTVIIDTTAIDTSTMIYITWRSDSVEVINPYANNGVGITCNGMKVTVSAASGISNLVYVLSGTATNANLAMNTDKKFVMMLNGVNLSAQGKPAINIKDSKNAVVHLAKGTVNTFSDNEANDGKACFYSKGGLTIQGDGVLNITSVSVNGLQGKNGVTMLNGDVTVGVSAPSAKGIKTDGDVTIEGGNLTVSASGTLTIDTLADGTFDKSYSSCIKPDGQFVMNGGNVTLTVPASNAGGKCVSTGSDMVMNGGYLTMTTAGNGACLGGTGSNASDGYVNACVKSDSNIYLYGGNISAISTGIGGRGICADGNLYVGMQNADNDLLHVYVQTSGATVNGGGNSGGGWPGGPGGNTSDSDYFKGIAKGIRIEGSIYINSGHLQAYCSQTSGDPTGEAIESKDSIIINGGDIEANAYDDAINGANYLEINGGRVWAYSRGNDGIDCNGNTTINGGLIMVKGNEVGIDSDVEHQNLFQINGGTIITQGGTMGAWDTPSSQSTQRWISVSSANNGNNGIVVIDNSGDTVLVYKNSSFSGSGFLNGSKGVNTMDKGNGTKPPPGGGGGGSTNGAIVISCPGMTRNAQYTVYKSATISGGSNWHGYYTGASAQGSGTSSTVTAQ